MMRRQTRTLRIVSACVVSGLAAGLLSATQCQYADADCRIAALAAFSPDPVPWTLWLHWINWLPGFVFGLLFALAAMPWAPFSGRRAVLYAIASAAIYLVAGLVFSAFLGVAGQDEFSLIVWIWPAGFVAGLLGALLLSLAGNQLLHPPNSAAGFFHGTPLPAAAGAILGVLFVLICSFGEQQIFISFPLAFVAWQVGVGLALSTPPGHGPVRRL